MAGGTQAVGTAYDTQHCKASVGTKLYCWQNTAGVACHVSPGTVLYRISNRKTTVHGSPAAC